MTNQVASGPRHAPPTTALAGQSRTTESRSKTPTRRNAIALTIILTCQMMLVLDATVMNVALPRIQSALHFSPTDLSWVMSAYTLSFGGLLLLGGRAGDILGRRRMFVAGITLFTVASLAGGLAPTSGALIGARIAQGVGAAMAGPSTIALITTTFTEARERIRALALLSAVARLATYLGTAASVPVLRRKLPSRPRTIRLPGGPAIPFAALAICIFFLSAATAQNFIAGGIALAIGALIYVSRRGSPPLTGSAG